MSDRQEDQLKDARDDLIAATALVVERIAELVSVDAPGRAIAHKLPALQGRLMAAIVHFGAVREGKG